MRQCHAIVAAACFAGIAFAAPALKSSGPTFIDLQEKGNQKLADDVGGNFPNNTLASLPTGEQTFASVKFKIGKNFIQLHSPRLKVEKPSKVEGIAVGQKVEKLHFLHSTMYGKGNPKIEDGTVIAEYRVRYEDGPTETIKVKYGEDVRDWWYAKDAPAEKTKEKVAWEGENEASKSINNGLRLYLTTWKNPKVGKKVVAIDFVRAEDTQASPFCVAITAE